MQNKKPIVLLHSCCAICSGYPISILENVVVYFYNPNIFPESEYLKRLEAQKELCAKYGVELLVDEYESEKFVNAAKGLENEPEKGKRCDACFELRLRKTAKKAKELGIENFTTSIVISPHKNFEKITTLGKKIAEEYGLNYIDVDFKKNDGFLKTNKIAKELDLYRQNYCGCQYSSKTTS